MKTLLCLACLLFGNSVFADDSTCSGNLSITEKNDGRLPVGVVPFEGFATNLYGSVSCGKWSFSSWVALETENDFNTNEIDFWIRYPLFENDSWKVLSGAAAYTFPGGTDHYLSELDIFYSGFVDVSLEIDHSWTKPGTSYIGTLSKKFELGKTRHASFSFTPSIMGACMNGFFGMTGCLSNVSYQGKFSASWGKKMEWGADFSVMHHKGGEYSKNGRDLIFDDGWGFSIGVNKSF